ncbi:MAG: 23S rRNA (adenine(2503)-C(2))-methyltransferase RlmN [Deltaproteobacteria bacterium]|nr:23S rRNA (adenine(2503)-C(2))-methyltransferase RlmN [Deltaproteobacteria bacterium]
MKTDLNSLSKEETIEWVKGLGIEPYRAGQIRQWLFQKMATSFDEMTNISVTVREKLKEKAFITSIEKVKTLVSEDTTEKYLFRLHDGNLIESVLIPEKDHFTICISSQAGCAMGCTFCHTARQGFKRNLTAGEIIEQVIETQRGMTDPDKLSNIVLMGMGEPLANYDAVITAINNLIDQNTISFSHRKITLSTCGLVPNIIRLGKDSPVNLAVSLNAGDDETRNRIMPINKTYNLKSLISACKEFPLPSRKMITFEYILIKGVNDSPADALKVAKLLRGVRAKINLIPLNPGPDPTMCAPSWDEMVSFQEILAENQYTVIIRKSKGQDILAACGQLSGRELT